VTPQRPPFFGYCIAKNQNKPGKNKALKMSTTKPGRVPGIFSRPTPRLHS
jgi:hypothetical protein